MLNISFDNSFLFERVGYQYLKTFLIGSSLNWTLNIFDGKIFNRDDRLKHAILNMVRILTFAEVLLVLAEEVHKSSLYPID